MYRVTETWHNLAYVGVTPGDVLNGYVSDLRSKPVHFRKAIKQFPVGYFKVELIAQFLSEVLARKTARAMMLREDTLNPRGYNEDWELERTKPPERVPPTPRGVSPKTRAKYLESRGQVIL